MVVSCDFDGVLFTVPKPFSGKVGKPIWPMIKAIRKAKELGHQIIIFTARSDGPDRDHAKKAKKALKKYGVPYDAFNKEVVGEQDGVKFRKVKLRKPAADVFVDDRNLDFVSAEHSAKSLLRRINGLH